MIGLVLNKNSLTLTAHSVSMDHNCGCGLRSFLPKYASIELEMYINDTIITLEANFKSMNTSTHLM